MWPDSVYEKPGLAQSSPILSGEPNVLASVALALRQGRKLPETIPFLSLEQQLRQLVQGLRGAWAGKK